MEEVYYYPYEPEPLSTISFTTGISPNGSVIDVVMLVIQECMDDICFIDSQNIMLNYSYSCCKDFYNGDIKLNHENSTQLKYHLEILSNNTWYTYDPDYISLKINDNPKEESNTSEEHVTTGFEFVILITSILLLVWKSGYKFKRK